MNKHLKSIPATEIKNRFGDYLGEVLSKREPLLIERHGKPVAVLVDLVQWQQQASYKAHSQTAEDFKDPWIEGLKKIHERILKTSKTSPKKFDAIALVRQIREEAL